MSDEGVLVLGICFIIGCSIHACSNIDTNTYTPEKGAYTAIEKKETLFEKLTNND